jgi:hypothetical protein
MQENMWPNLFQQRGVYVQRNLLKGWWTFYIVRDISTKFLSAMRPNFSPRLRTSYFELSVMGELELETPPLRRQA